MGKCGPQQNLAKYISSKGFMRAIQKCNFYWIWATVSKVMTIYVKFTMTTHQIWSCHVTVPPNSENFYFSPNSILDFRKSNQIWGEISSRTKKLQARNNWRVENTPSSPVLIGLIPTISTKTLPMTLRLGLTHCSRPLPIGKNKKVIGLMKDKLMKRIILRWINEEVKPF